MADLLNDGSIDEAVKELLDNECDKVRHEVSFTELRGIAKNVCRENGVEWNENAFQRDVMQGITSGSIAVDEKTQAALAIERERQISELYSAYTSGRLNRESFLQMRSILKGY